MKHLSSIFDREADYTISKAWEADQRAKHQTAAATTDTQARRQLGSIADVMEYNSDNEKMYNDYMYSSFYLPREVLHCRRFVVKPVRVITGIEFRMLLASVNMHRAETKEPEVTLGYEGCTWSMCCNAKLVGISERMNITTQQTHLIAKIWYGKGNK